MRKNTKTNTAIMKNLQPISGKRTVTVGIPAYLSENNIVRLLECILVQKQRNYSLRNIIVYCDKSGDSTLQKALEVKDKKVIVIEGKMRKGFAHGVKVLINRNISDILILLNDDVIIRDEYFVSKIVRPFHEEEYVGLVCGNPQPIKVTTFIEKALATRLKASERLSYLVNNGSNVFSCDGKILALSAEFIKKLSLPRDNQELGNVDAFLYFSCITQGMKYRFVRDAKVYYRNPTIFTDYVKWISRNNTQKNILYKNFDSILINKEYTKPKIIFIYTTFTEFLKNPFGGLVILLIESIIHLKALLQTPHFGSTWDVVKTTKNLN